MKKGPLRWHFAYTEATITWIVSGSNDRAICKMKNEKPIVLNIWTTYMKYDLWHTKKLCTLVFQPSTCYKFCFFFSLQNLFLALYSVCKIEIEWVLFYEIIIFYWQINYFSFSTHEFENPTNKNYAEIKTKLTSKIIIFIHLFIYSLGNLMFVGLCFIKYDSKKKNSFSSLCMQTKIVVKDL